MLITILESEAPVVVAGVLARDKEFVRDVVKSRAPLDTAAAIEGNMLVENTEDELCLEIRGRARLSFDDDCVISLTGALFSVSINGESIPHYCAAQVDKGDGLTVENTSLGGVMYIAVNGIWESQKRVLSAGDSVTVNENSENLYNMDLRCMNLPEKQGENLIRLIPGPYAQQYGEHTLELLYTTEFTVKSSDRERVCLSGVPVGSALELDGLAYAPVGSVILGEEGEPCILLQDSAPLTRCKCIATVISSDISRLVQLGMGERLRFSPCTVQASQKLMTYARKEYIMNYLTLNSYQIEE